MTKNIKTLSRLLTSILLTSILCIGLVLPALADNGPIAEGTESLQAKTAITKLLQMPAETTTPNATFNFVFKKESVNESKSDADKATMPDITGVIVTFADTDEGNTDENGIKSVYKETGSVFDGVEWKHAGVYVYTVSEEQDTYTPIGPFSASDDVIEEMSYSQASYEISVYVKEGSNGDLYIAAITAKIVQKDDSSEGENGDKVDPMPGTEGEYSNVIFTNVYLKNNNGTDPEKDAVLSISNKVENDYADKSKKFDFSVRISNPATVNHPERTFMAYLLNENNSVISPDNHVSSAYIKTDSAGRKYIEFTHNAALTVSLMHGQTLSFVGVPVGAIYHVENKAHANYTPGYELSLNDVMHSSDNGILSGSLSTKDRYVGEFKNNADFINRYKLVNEMGISVDNIPYIALICIILIGLSVYIIVKSRKNTKKA